MKRTMTSGAPWTHSMRYCPSHRFKNQARSTFCRAQDPEAGQWGVQGNMLVGSRSCAASGATASVCVAAHRECGRSVGCLQGHVW